MALTQARISSTLTRRKFSKTLLAGGADLALSCPLSRAASKAPFAFVLLGDLHFDKPEHHDLDWLQKEKPDDVRQVRDYSRITREIHPKLFATVRETVAGLNDASETRVPFALHVGDFVEGLCGNAKLAAQQNTEAIEFVRTARLTDAI